MCLEWNHQVHCLIVWIRRAQFESLKKCQTLLPRKVFLLQILHSTYAVYSDTVLGFLRWMCVSSLLQNIHNNHWHKWWKPVLIWFWFCWILSSFRLFYGCLSHFFAIIVYRLLSAISNNGCTEYIFQIRTVDLYRYILLEQFTICDWWFKFINFNMLPMRLSNLAVLAKTKTHNHICRHTENIHSSYVLIHLFISVYSVRN